jgi:nucleotide-binding universal stress UspA family protein
LGKFEKKMKLLIVPTDFSTISDNATKYAMDMALALGARIMLLNVYQIPISFSEVPLVTISLDQLKYISENKLNELKDNLTRISDNKISISVQSILGEVSEEVKKLCDHIKPFAVIMGTRGVSGIGKFFLGSNTMTVIGKTETPVFVIPPGATFKPYKKVGLATDMQDVVHNMPIEEIREIVTFFNADLHVLNVDNEKKHFTTYTPEESLNLDTMLSGLNPVYNFIENKDIDEGLNEFAAKNNIDLLITLPKKHEFLEKILEKSHTRELIYNTTIPLMCIHQKINKSVSKSQHF